MYRKVAKLGAVKTDRNWSRSERKLAVSCMGGLLVARVPGCQETSRIHPSRREVAIPHAYAAPAKSTKPEVRELLRKACRGGDLDLEKLHAIRQGDFDRLDESDWEEVQE